jgi:CobQ-like glutamine amidotransferase family enzyme
MTAAVSVALVYPDLLGTYGDGGNAIVLAERLRWRGIEADLVTVRAAEAVPASCEIYVLGGGEDLPQALAARKLAESGALHRAAGAGAVVLAICAGLQVLGESFVGPDGKENEGLGLLGCVTKRTERPRAVGEVLVEPSPEWGELGLLSGFENHAAVTELGEGTKPVGFVKVGVGNKDGTLEGAVKGRIWGTYLHGPVLARNPALADLLLSWAVGRLEPLDDSLENALHDDRVAHAAAERRRLAEARRPRRWAGLLGGPRPR